MDGTAREVVRRSLAAYHPPVLYAAGLTPASVLILVYEREGEPIVLLSKRSDDLETHPGEIAFPGGRHESEDLSLLQTALRETHEEVGVNPKDVEVLGELGQFTTSSNYLISSFVGTITYPYEFNINNAEVASLLEVPVEAFLDYRNVRDEIRVVQEELNVQPIFAYSGNLIYGATARMMERFLEVVVCGSLDSMGKPVMFKRRVSI